MKILYVHGYGTNGNARKAQVLREKYPEHELLCPTIDYDNVSPFEVQDMLRAIVEENGVGMIVGSSLGGFFALSSTAWYEGPVWCVNPVRKWSQAMMAIVFGYHLGLTSHRTHGNKMRMLFAYMKFNRKVFRRLPQRDDQLSFALSKDDRLLGSHEMLLKRFRKYKRVVWKDNCGHRFTRFDEVDLF